MKWKLYGATVLFFVFILCILYIDEVLFTSDVETVTEVKSIEYVPDYSLVEGNYKNSNKYTEIDTNIYKIYVTVFDKVPNSSGTLSEIKSQEYVIGGDNIQDDNDIFAYSYFSDSEHGLNQSPNSTIELRGQSARLAEQKSYKIKIFDNEEFWNGYRIINLNKHFKDEVRLRNKLSFDIFKSIDNFSSMETKFVEVLIRNLEYDETEFTSYGLFTFIEQPNRDFLEKYFNDRTGALYKAEFFEFRNYEAVVESDNISYNMGKFEQYLEIRGSKKHKDFKNMLMDLNDYNMDIDEVIDKHFDEENMLTWLACNILLHNYDTSSRNYMLYSPTNSEKWYFLPWDYDKGWSFEQRSALWQKGLFNYWGMILFNRYFRKEGSFEKFEVVLKKNYADFSQDKVYERLLSYSDIVEEYLFKEPDFLYSEIEKSEYSDYLGKISTVPENNLQYYYDNIETPMPFYLGTPEIYDDRIIFNWNDSFDVQGDQISYEFVLSTDSLYEEILVHEESLFLTTIVISPLESGIYYWKVIASDSKGNTQISFDYSTTEIGDFLHGSKRLEIKGDEIE